MATDLEPTERTLPEICLDMLEDQIENDLSIQQLSDKYGVSTRQVYNRLSKGQEVFYAILEEQGQKLRAKIWKEYEWAKSQLRDEWERTRDIAVIAQYRAVLKDMADLMKLAKPPKAPVNESGLSVPDKLIFVINDSAYLAKEKEYEEKQKEVKMLEGEYSTIGDSSKSDTIEE